MPNQQYTIAIVGLGLMGGSLAYGLRGFKDCEIIGTDIDTQSIKKALKAGAIDKSANTVKEAVKQADLAIFCTPPKAILSYLDTHIGYFKKGAVITEICGVKHEIVSAVTSKLPPDVDYIGLHPMAGKEVDGFDNADAAIFRNAGFLLVLHDRCRESTVTLMKELSAYVGAGRVCINRALEHDGIIAYTSDLMHIAAAALCEEYPPNMTMAHTAGAFRDCTRIANINAALWTELLVANADSIIPCLETYIKNLSAFKTALKENDQAFMHGFLDKACVNKKEMQKL